MRRGGRLSHYARDAPGQIFELRTLVGARRKLLELLVVHSLPPF
jgi:hypothetical protein